MKKGKLWILVFGISYTILAQTSNAQTIGLYGSRVESDEMDTLYGAGLHFTLPFTESLFVSAQATSYPDYTQIRGVGPQKVPLAVNAEFLLADLGLGWQTPILGSTSFYASAGLSYLWADAEYTLAGRPTQFELENDAGWYTTLGVSSGSALQLFFELQYRNLEGKITGPDIPPGYSSLQNFELKHVAGNLGVRYTW